MTLGSGLQARQGAATPLAPIIVAAELVTSLGVGLVFQSPLVALRAGVAARDVAAATVPFAFARRFAASVLVVAGGVVFRNGIQWSGPCCRRR